MQDLLEALESEFPENALLNHGLELAEEAVGLLLLEDLDGLIERPKRLKDQFVVSWQLSLVFLEVGVLEVRPEEL